MTSAKQRKIEGGNRSGDDIEGDIKKILLEDCDFEINTLIRLRDHLQNSKDNVSCISLSSWLLNVLISLIILFLYFGKLSEVCLGIKSSSSYIENRAKDHYSFAL